MLFNSIKKEGYIMSHKTDIPYITNDNILIFLDSFAQSLLYRYRCNIEHVNILIVGGAALALKYNFRGTVDIDADINFRSNISNSIHDVAIKHSIPDDWMNQDFTMSASYSKYLWSNAILVQTFYNFMWVYVVTDIDQLCMKVISGRQKDNNDINLLTQKCISNNFTYSMFLKEYEFLYGNSVKPNAKALNKVKRIFKKFNML